MKKKVYFFYIFIFHYSFLDSLATRGERLELLVNKTENLSASVCILSSTLLNYRARSYLIGYLLQSVTFRKSSRNLARSLFWKNIKISVFAAIVILVSEIMFLNLLFPYQKFSFVQVCCYFITSIACGGLNWQGCLKK